MRKEMVGIGLAALVLLASTGALPGNAAKFNKVVDIGAPMPQFSALPTADGKTLSSTDLKESVVVLVFLANHCPWVRGMEGDIVKLVGQFKGKDVRFVGVSVNHRDDDRLDAMKTHAAKSGYNFTYVYDESQDLGRSLGATRTPEFFVFNKARKLVYMGLLYNSPASMRTDGTINYTKGAPTEFYVKDAVGAALAGKPVPVDETRPQGCMIEYEQVRS
jgi:cytochrome oxidase Cu insertion factor (SCO1/SenC/PrrC family)